MLLETEIVASGEFWFSDQPKSRIGGTLSIDKYGDINLELFDYPGGMLMDPERLVSEGYLDTNELIPISTIFGHTHPYGQITLEDCRDNTSMYFTPGPSPLKLIPKRAILGVHHSRPSDIKVSKLIVGIKDLHEWLQKTGLDIEISGDRRTISAKLSLPDSINLASQDDVDISVIFSPNKPGSPIIGFGQPNVNITEYSYISLKPRTTIPLNNILEIAGRIRDFISLGVGSSLPLVSVSAYSPDVSHPPTLGVAQQDLFHCVFKDGQRHQISWTRPHVYMPFHYGRISADIGMMLGKWLDIYDQLSESFKLYHWVVGSDLIEDNIKFLWMTQVLESLHRDYYSDTCFPNRVFEETLMSIREQFRDQPDIRKWLDIRLKYANELSLRQRLKNLFETIRPQDKAENYTRSFINDIVDARNFLTHRDENITNGVEIVRSGRISLLTEMLIGVFQLWNLKQIGFNDSMILDVLTRNEELGSIFGYQNIFDDLTNDTPPDDSSSTSCSARTSTANCQDD